MGNLKNEWMVSPPMFKAANPVGARQARLPRYSRLNSWMMALLPVPAAPVEGHDGFLLGFLADVGVVLVDDVRVGPEDRQNHGFGHPGLGAMRREAMPQGVEPVHRHLFRPPGDFDGWLQADPSDHS